MIFVATKNGRTEKKSGIRDLGCGMDENQDPGSGISIPAPQHFMEIVSGVHQFFCGMPSTV